MNTTGRTMAMIAAVAARAAKRISAVPRLAARIGGIPPSTWRLMFSCTMIASSTTTPTARASARRVKVLKV